MGNRRPPRREGHGPARGSRPTGPARHQRPPAPGPHRAQSQSQQSQSQSQSRTRTTAQERPQPSAPERLQKVLAHAGIGSRRGCEEVILQGRVTVDGKVVRELGTRVDPARQFS